MATKRLIEFIEKQSLKRTFVGIAEDIGLDEGTIRNIFRDYVNLLEKTVQFETPKLLGIDEIHIVRPRCVICNVQQRTIIDMLPNRNKDTVIRYLYKRLEVLLRLVFSRKVLCTEAEIDLSLIKPYSLDFCILYPIDDSTAETPRRDPRNRVI